MDAQFTLGPKLDVAHLRSVFAARGRMEIADFLTPADARRLRDHLIARKDWLLVVNAGGSAYELPKGSLGDAQRRELDDRVIAAARSGFQYRYEAIRVPDDAAGRSAEQSPLAAFVRFMASPPVLALLADITGLGDLAFADGQATAYSPGDFLTRHDDDVAGKNRRAAYVLGLSPVWRAEWGGLLMFHRADGNIDEAFVPAMGALRLFAVPVDHSVSYVAPFADGPRLAVTGWLRSSAPDQSSA